MEHFRTEEIEEAAEEKKEGEAGVEAQGEPKEDKDDKQAVMKEPDIVVCRISRHISFRYSLCVYMYHVYTPPGDVQFTVFSP
jgi:hypothetical protein